MEIMEWLLRIFLLFEKKWCLLSDNDMTATVEICLLAIIIELLEANQILTFLLCSAEILIELHFTDMSDWIFYFVS